MADDPGEALDGTRPEPAVVTFSTLVVDSWRLYSENLATLFGLFALIALVMTAVPSLFVFDFADSLALPLYLLLAVVLPAVLASIGFGIASLVLWNRERTGLAAQMHPVTVRAASASLGSQRKELLASALLSGMIGLAVAVFLGGLGLLLLGVFFGPPILVQVVTVERMNVQTGWGRARELLRGRIGRVLLYLLTIALGISLLSAVALNVVLRLTGDMANAVRYIALGGSQVLIAGLTIPLLACASYVCYRMLRAENDFIQETPSQD